jgi:hypothetical protein
VRGIVSGLAGLLAALLLPVAITAVWTAERVTDTDGYVGAVGPLVDDEDVQEALVDRLEEYAAEAVGVSALGEAQQQQARPVIRGALMTAVTSSTFRAVWEEANRAGHDQLVTTLAADRIGEVVPLRLDVMVDAVVEALRREGLAVRDVPPPNLVYTPDEQQLRAAQEGYQALDAARIWLPLAWVVLVVVTLAVARRRLRALAVLASASLVSVALMWPALAGARSMAVDAAPEADRELVEAVWNGVTGSLERGVLIAVIVAAIALVVAAVLGAVRRTD